jgi:hypothetical protein
MQSPSTAEKYMEEAMKLTHRKPKLPNRKRCDPKADPEFFVLCIEEERKPKLLTFKEFIARNEKEKAKKQTLAKEKWLRALRVRDPQVEEMHHS